MIADCVVIIDHDEGVEARYISENKGVVATSGGSDPIEALKKLTDLLDNRHRVSSIYG